MMGAAVVTLITGLSHRVDRNLSIDVVAQRINSARRVSSSLLELPDDRTPSRTFWINPEHVISIAERS